MTVQPDGRSSETAVAARRWKQPGGATPDGGGARRLGGPAGIDAHVTPEGCFGTRQHDSFDSVAALTALRSQFVRSCLMFDRVMEITVLPTAGGLAAARPPRLTRLRPSVWLGRRGRWSRPPLGRSRFSLVLVARAPERGGPRCVAGAPASHLCSAATRAQPPGNPAARIAMGMRQQLLASSWLFQAAGPPMRGGALEDAAAWAVFFGLAGRGRRRSPCRRARCTSPCRLPASVLLASRRRDKAQGRARCTCPLCSVAGTQPVARRRRLLAFLRLARRDARLGLGLASHRSAALPAALVLRAAQRAAAPPVRRSTAPSCQAGWDYPLAQSLVAEGHRLAALGWGLGARAAAGMPLHCRCCPARAAAIPLFAAVRLTAGAAGCAGQLCPPLA